MSSLQPLLSAYNRVSYPPDHKTSGHTKIRKTGSMAAFPLLDLPAELRIKVYGYLLLTKYNKVEVTYHRRGLRPVLPIPMPTHHYRFHTAILGANRQVNSEAANVFYRRNLFVSLTCGYSKFGTKLESLVVVAKSHHANNFKNCSMEVHLSPHGHSDEGSQSPLEKFIIAGEDVPSFCNILPGLYFEPNSVRSHENQTSINVTVQVNAEGVADTEIGDTGPENDFPSVKRLLEPFCRLHGMRIRVGGFVTPSYKKRIEQCAARQPLTAIDLVSMVSKYRDEGNEATVNGKLVTAAKRYQWALDMLNPGYTRLTDNPGLVETPVLSEKRALAMMEFLHIILRSVLAATYLELGEYAKAYRCAQDRGLTKWDVWWNRETVLKVKMWQVCAHILFCKALAGKALGQPVQALMDLDLGLRFEPHDKEIRRERKVMCFLVLKKLDSDLGVGLRACASATRSTKPKHRQDSEATPKLVSWKNLETLIKGSYIA